MDYITILNKTGLELTLCSIGASIYDIKVPDKNNIVESIVTHPNKESFPYATGYFGKTCGRTGGRIEDNKFTIANVEYHIKSNDPNALHGGIEGFSFKSFSHKVVEKNEFTDVIFTYQSKDMEGGYPGNLNITVTYTIWKNKNEIKVAYSGCADKKTLCNITNHTYYNLSGNVKRNVLNHNLFINASTVGYIENAIPVKLNQVNEVFDFKDFHKIYKYIDDKQLLSTNGYDHPYLFDKVDNSKPNVILYDEISGRKLEMSTDYPAIVIYTDNYPEDLILQNGCKHKKNDAVCLEAQFFPNSINSKFIENKMDLLDSDSLFFHFFLLKFTA